MGNPEFDPTRLSPDVLAVLETASKTGMPPMETLAIGDMREAYRQIGVLLGGEPVPVAKSVDLAARGPAGDIPLRLYLPAVPKNVSPATIYFHGGGWCIGGIDTHDKVCRRLAHESGHPIVSVEYRLAPEHPAPAGPDDAVAATRWIYDHAGELGLDASRLAVAGDSAGGSLSAVVTQQLRSIVPLVAQILFYPCTDLSPASSRYPSRSENANVPPLTLAAMHAMADPFAGELINDPRVSPLCGKDLQDLPPALIFTGECDVLRDDGRFYADALKKAGVPVEHIELPGMVHGFIEMAGVLPAARQTFERAGAFLRSRFVA
ncbi:alpha/beta hydrolase [Sphingobium yanoikuyae]|uniref:alpha/beta hydrolase n=1 Tax=Sphingobium yanoikuyae TaxID=13690 RepID=UPI0022DD6991|nr:alpha/beta hydrolase [Sphingobium yanoikuyae]WBQ17616.1 alpha/beta hydrolase [Sphingobium yanoikuyae]